MFMPSTVKAVSHRMAVLHTLPYQNYEENRPFKIGDGLH